MSDVTMGTVTAKVTTDNSQFDAGMKKSADAVSQVDAAVKRSSEVIGATARENAKAAKMQADALAFGAKYAGDAVNEQSLRIVTSLKAQTMAEADMRKARQLAKMMDEEGSTKLLAAAYQRLTTAKLETAAASRVEAAATEATVLTQRSAVSAVVRASEGQEGIRAVEGFLTMIPGVGAALQGIFPLVGGAMFVAMLARMGGEFYDLEQKARHAGQESSRAWAEFNDKLSATNDELALTDSKLRDQIDKLSGHPSNGLETALLEAKVAADKLQESLAADLKALDAVLNQNSVSVAMGVLNGLAPTGSAERAIQQHAGGMQDAGQAAQETLDKRLDAAKSAHEQAVAEAGGNHAKLKAADDAFNAARLTAQNANYAAQKKAAQDFAAWNRQMASDIADLQAHADASLEQRENSLSPAEFARLGRLSALRSQYGYGSDLTQIRQQYEAAARAGTSIALRSDESKSVFNDTQTLGVLNQKKALASAGNKADEERLRQMEATLKQMELLRNVDLKTEFNYWEIKKSEFLAGSTEYNAIVAKQADLAEQAAKAAHQRILRFQQQATRADAMAAPQRDALLAWHQHDARAEQDRYDTSNELYAIQQKTVLRLEEMRIRQEAGRSLTQEAAALEMAAVHTREYGAELARLEAEKKAFETNPLLTNNAEDQQKKIDELKKQIAQLEGGRQIQIQEDAYAVKDADRSAVDGATQALVEFANSATNASEAMKSWLSGAISSTNDAIVKGLTGPNWERGREFTAAGHEIFTSAASSVLKYGEGMLLKGLGVGGKADGSTEGNALWVRIAGMLGGPSLPKLPGMPEFSGSGAGGGMGGDLQSLVSALNTGFSMPNVTQAGGGASGGGGGFGGFVSSAAGFLLHAIPGFANGGDYPGNSLMMVGENGPEIMAPRSAGTIIPNHALGGDTHNWDINVDARNASDPAQVHAAVQRGIAAAAPHIIRAMDERRMRRPSMKR